MKRSYIVVMVAALLAAVTLAVDLQLTVTRKTRLKGQLEDLVVFGLLKEMTCDSNGNIFSPSTRKYSSAINAIVRFPHDGSSFTTFSIDSLGSLDRGTITDFDLQPSGDVFVLARQVLKNFILRYSQDGKVLFQREAKLDNDNFSPTGFLLLQDDEFLVVGYRIDKGKTFLTAEILRSNGNLRTRFNLNPEGTKTSREKTVASPRVFHPTAIRANGQIYVLRGTTTEPIYVLSESGQLLKTIQLKPTDLEFDSPKVLSNELVVRAHSPFFGPIDRDCRTHRAPTRKSTNLQLGNR